MILTHERPLLIAGHRSPLSLPLSLSAQQEDPVQIYERRFGAVPAWFAEISLHTARSLARQAIGHGVPLAAADCIDFGIFDKIKQSA